jgi:hypothetical protein
MRQEHGHAQAHAPAHTAHGPRTPAQYQTLLAELTAEQGKAKHALLLAVTQEPKRVMKPRVNGEHA